LFQTRNFAGASRPAAYFPKSAFGSVPVWFTNFAQFTTRPDPANRVQPLPEVSRRGGRHARLFRADLLLTGVLFERQLDARISFGPFHNSRCRLDDLADSNRVAMHNTFQDRPAFGVFGPRF